MPGWPRTRSYRQKEAVVSHMLHHGACGTTAPWRVCEMHTLGIWMSKETLSMWVTPLTLSEQTLEPGCLDSNLDTTPHWLGKLFHFSDPCFSHLQNGYDHGTYLIGLLWGLIELIHKVDFRTLYTIITILTQNLKPCRVSVQPKEDFCQKCVKVEGSIGKLWVGKKIGNIVNQVEGKFIYLQGIFAF